MRSDDLADKEIDKSGKEGQGRNLTHGTSDIREQHLTLADTVLGHDALDALTGHDALIDKAEGRCS